jgi:uncharacterized cupin superfamily protein
MVRRARLTRDRFGRRPAGPGWFVLNAAQARWLGHPHFGFKCDFEGARPFAHLGINLRVIAPGQPNCHYHHETEEEVILVLSGSCRLLVEEQVVPLKAWDFVYLPPGTAHVVVGAGRGPCSLLMAGRRRRGAGVTYPVSRLALRYRAGVRKKTNRPRVSYAGLPPRRPARLRWPPR